MWNAASHCLRQSSTSYGRNFGTLAETAQALRADARASPMSAEPRSSPPRSSSDMLGRETWSTEEAVLSPSGWVSGEGNCGACSKF